MDENIEAAITLLQQEPQDTQNPPTIVIPPADIRGSILGNKGGFVLLAIAAMKAAQGQDQEFEREPWVQQEEFDGEIAGLKFDALAHMHLPEKPTKRQKQRRDAIGLAAGLLLSVCFLIGFVTLVHWAFLCLRRL